ncbi:hypothetical protein [Natronobacterium gregoryi]|uniref:Uncharacterized protein n=2 Tax=Natronobacterium gregoryi TaxID=44930 RepID=L0AGV9_NATGS|nr:hypothetical protein Natgr_1866 [Natronobacterium gregoryi SP2]ELY70843.1 hypothetical protein C490_06117 [Natronobacterium gregoryi SP2]PLK20424.1 hypothetical protein CYV19_09865 [Natronobacterium gregoryi SP2]SFI62687.1 hypothetical protein SAMN05443661_102215 [Natronobacterium gregoryi]
MSRSDDRRDDLLIALTLTEFSVHYEDVDPELAERAWQFAADRLVEYASSRRISSVNSRSASEVL